jgi:hypothetical protein
MPRWRCRGEGSDAEGAWGGSLAVVRAIVVSTTRGRRGSAGVPLVSLATARACPGG